MRHRLVAPGCEWLVPFAETRIKQLLKLGNPYADQSFYTNGCTVRVRVEPGHEYIKIDGGVCSLSMESGIVESIRHDTTVSAAYHAAFTKVSADGLYKSHPGNGKAGEVAGEISKGSDAINGRIPTSSESLAFSPKKEKKTDEFGVVTMETVERDGNLWNKKYTVANCPASIFTGRCRLYVQAMYGAPLYKVTGGEYILNWFCSGALSVPSYWGDKKKPRPSGVNLNTSTGVYLDPQTGKHWLFAVATGFIDVYPLIADPCGESARALLRPGATLTLDGTDKKHLEAFILSTCMPDQAKVQRVPYSGKIADGTSMGYGWHWNYSGTRCDIAKNKTIAANEADHTASRVLIMESTHHSLTVAISRTPNDDPDAQHQSWSASLTKVSGPSKWGVERGLFCITAPRGAWLEKQTPFRLNSYSPTNSYAGSGTFYVFYKGDEIQVCRVIVTEVPEQTTRWSSSNETEIGHYTKMSSGGTLVFYLRGWQGSGWYKSNGSINHHFTVQFVIGAMGGTSAMPTLKIDSTPLYRRSGPGSRGAAGPDYIYTTPISNPGTQTPFPYRYNVGAPKGPPTEPVWDTVTIPSDFYRYSGYDSCDIPHTITFLEMTYWGRAVVSTPQWDSEAIYCCEDKWEQEKNTGRATVITTIPIDLKMIAGEHLDGGGVKETMVRSTIWWDAELHLPTSPNGTGGVETIEVTKTITKRTLACRAGVIDITGGYADKIQANIDATMHITIEDEVYANYNTISGTTDDGPALAWGSDTQLARHALIPPKGAKQTDYAVVVGWV